MVSEANGRSGRVIEAPPGAVGLALVDRRRGYSEWRPEDPPVGRGGRDASGWTKVNRRGLRQAFRPERATGWTNPVGDTDDLGDYQVADDGPAAVSVATWLLRRSS